MIKVIAADTPEESADHLENDVIPFNVISFEAMFTLPPMKSHELPELVDLNNFKEGSGFPFNSESSYLNTRLALRPVLFAGVIS
ncbi:MAG: hypothetical protein R2942_06650 [Ignavibacteria bacterium]